MYTEAEWLGIDPDAPWFPFREPDYSKIHDYVYEGDDDE